MGRQQQVDCLPPDRAPGVDSDQHLKDGAHLVGIQQGSSIGHLTDRIQRVGPQRFRQLLSDGGPVVTDQHRPPRAFGGAVGDEWPGRRWVGPGGCRPTRAAGGGDDGRGAGRSRAGAGSNRKCHPGHRVVHAVTRLVPRGCPACDFMIRSLTVGPFAVRPKRWRDGSSPDCCWTTGSSPGERLLTP